MKKSTSRSAKSVSEEEQDRRMNNDRTTHNRIRNAISGGVLLFIQSFFHVPLSHNDTVRQGHVPQIVGGRPRPPELGVAVVALHLRLPLVHREVVPDLRPGSNPPPPLNFL